MPVISLSPLLFSSHSLSARARLFVCCAASALLLSPPALGDTITWTGGTGNWNDPASWDSGTVPLATDNALVDGEAAGDSAVTVTTAATINDLTISTGDSISVNNAQTFTLTGDLFNHGTFTLNSTGSTTSVDIVDGSTFLGSGTFVLTHPSARITGNAGAVLTNAANHTIEGSGNIGAAQLRLDNAGLIVANQANALTLNLQSGSTSINTGTLRAEAGRTLTLATGGSGFTVDNTGGLIEALDGAQVQLRNGIRVEGGTLATSGTGFIRLEATTLDGVTNTGLTQVSAAGARLAGTIVNDGELRLNSSGSATTFSLEGDVRLEGTGALTASNSTANNINAASGFAGSVLTNTADHTIRGSGSLGFATMGLVNEGLILADQSAQLTVNLSNDVSQENRRNTGIMRAENGATLAISSTVLDNTGGLIEARGAGSFIRLDGVNNRIIGGTLNTEDDSTVAIFAGSALEDLRNDGNVRVQNSQTGKLKGTIENFGEIAVASIGSQTTLEIEGDTTLTGDGQLRMTNHSSNRIIGSPVTSVLTNDVDHLITGSGSLGVNNLGLVNLGTIEADGSVGLTVNLRNDVGVRRENRGTMRALSGSTLTISDTDLDNTNGTIEAQAGGTVSFTGANTRITGGVLTGDGDVDLRGSATLVDLRNEARTAVANSQTGRIEVAIDNAGVIALESIVSQTTLTILGDTTLSGGGVVEMSNNANNRITGSPTTAVLTNATDHTIRGAGQIGIAGNMGLINEGLIEAVGSAGLTILLNTDETVARTNTGTLRATDGATLTLGASAFDMRLANAGGLIEAQDGGTVSIVGSRILGGTLDTEGTGVINLRNFGVLSDLRNDGFVQVANAQSGSLQGTIENFGEIALDSVGSFTQLRLLGDVTLSGPGLLTGSNNTNNTIFGTPNTTLTQGADHTIRGAFNIGNTGNMALSNDGVIEADGSAGITMRLSSEVPNTNSGAMRALSGSELRISSTVLNNTGGLIEAMDGGAVTISGGRIDGGRLDTDGTGVIDLVSSAVLADLRNDGFVRLDNGRTGRLSGSIENFGTISLESVGSATALDLAENTTLSGTGELVLGNRTTIRLSSLGGDKVLTNAAGHTIRGGGTIGFGGGSLGLFNQGLIDADDSVALTINPNATLGPVVNTGTMRASGAGGLVLTGGSFDNQGLVEAVNGSSVSYTTSGITLNNQSGNLALGSWRVAGDGSTIDIRGPAIEQNTAEIILDGAGSQFRSIDLFTTETLEESLGSNNSGGILRILGGRDYTVQNASNFLNNWGLIELGGGTFASGGFSNQGSISGFGTIIPNYANFGTTEARGGTLTAQNGFFASGTARSLTGGTLALGADSFAGVLELDGGALALGAHDMNVSGDYTNKAFGSGNAFDRRANVTGSGQIMSAGSGLTVEGDVETLGPDAFTLNFGTLRGGDVATRDFNLRNDGTFGSVRGALQTGANGANVDDTRLSGSGVLAQNFDAIGAFDFDLPEFSVSFEASSGGALAGQSLAVVSNFDNIATQSIALEGFATQRAVGLADPLGVVDLGNFRVGLDGPSQSFDVTNLTEGAGAERLGIASATAAGNFVGSNLLGAGLIDAGATATGAASVAVSGGVVGENTGNLELSYTTDGTEFDAAFTAETANAQIIGLSATGYRMAEGEIFGTTFTIGPQREGATPALGALVITNNAPDDGFSEALNVNVASTSGGAVSDDGSVNQLAAGGFSIGDIRVGVDTTNAGAISGTVTLGMQSDGEGTSGLGTFDLASRDIQVAGNVYRIAEAQLNSAPLNFGTVQVGEAVSQTLSFSNIATGPAGFVEDLMVSFGATSGTGAGQISGSGSIGGLVAGGTDSSSMVVTVNTAVAGTILGNIAIDYASAGTVGGIITGLEVLSLGSELYPVSGVIDAVAHVVDQASPQINTVTPIDLGNVRVGDVSPEAIVSVSNLASGNDQAALNATISGDGTITAEGAFDLLAPGATNDMDLTVGMQTSMAGAVAGTATLGLVSDASNIGGCEPNCQLTLASQTVAVTGGIYLEAQPELAETVDLGNFRLGDAPLAALTVTNTNTAPLGFQEGLDVSASATSGLATVAGGPIVNLLAGFSSEDIQLGLDGGAASAGLNTGTVTLALSSNGEGTSGLPTLALPEAVVNVLGIGYRVAAPELNTTSLALAARVGDSSPTAAISVTNASPDIFTEALGASLGTAPAGFEATGTIAALGAQGTDDTSLTVGLNTANAGVFGGGLEVAFASTGLGTTGAEDLALGTQEVALSGRVYQAAIAEVTTPLLDFGIVHVGEAVTAQTIGIVNAAPLAGLNDTLAASLAGPATGGVFTGSGAVSGLFAGESDDSSMFVAVDTSSAGIFSGAQSIAFASQNPDLEDLDLGLGNVALAVQVNNFANPLFTQLSGAGLLTGSGTNFFLDFGTVDLGATLSASLGVLNDIFGPADVLGGSFDLPSSGPFSLTGFDSFTDIGAQELFGGLGVGFSALDTGLFESQLSLNAFGSNASGFFGTFDPIQLSLRAQVRDLSVAPIPLPAGVWLLLSALGGLAVMRRRTKRAA